MIPGLLGRVTPAEETWTNAGLRFGEEVGEEEDADFFASATIFETRSSNSKAPGVCVGLSAPSYSNLDSISCSDTMRDGSSGGAR